jgi:CheY-like chemotaxis protein
MSVTTATTEALTCVPDLVLLDINLPGMDGWEFLEIVSKNSALKSKIKIAILSNLPKEDYIEKAESFDCVFNYIEKPLTESHLIEMANQFL